MAQLSDQSLTLLAQDLALGTYLNDLLQQATESAVEDKSDVVTTLDEADVSPSASKALAEVPVPELTPQVESETGIPLWGQQEFQCLLFYVGSLKLAIPLVKLARIKPWGEHVTATPGRPAWFLGLLGENGNKTGLIDTARLVFPRDRYSQLYRNDDLSEPGHILIMEDGHWGLTCDSLGEIIVLTPDTVRWRTDRTSRRWLAGTVIDQMCALLDVGVLANIIDTDDSPLL
ncbi:chemotaxis protein CheW [Acidihalobacter prosperus]